MIEARIILDSINPIGNRITTFIVKTHRFTLAEFNTHRMFSRNSASSRAIPSTTIIKTLMDEPALPIHWGKLQKGMQANEEVGEVVKEHCKAVWLEARDNAIKSVNELLQLGLHKQVANRLLEPFMWQTILMTATDLENFFSLRAHEAAQPEFQHLAFLMLAEYNKSVPNELEAGEWHIPFADKHAEGLSDADKLKVCTARAARVSYANFEGQIDHQKDFGLHDSLRDSGHWSPFEHAAQAVAAPLRFGNFIGWKQYRKFFDGENRKDERVKRVM
jgi:thymidylate synthase ThyX